MQSGESFCIRAKNVCSASRAARFRLCLPLEGKVPEGRMRCSAAARLCRQMLHFDSLTEILSLRYRLSVFLSRRKKNSEKERPLRGLRRGVRFIMSPPGKRRHNELNAAPPPETPRRTGKPGEASDRGGVQSGESFCVRGKTCLPGEPRGTTPTLASPQRGSQGLRDQITQTIYLYHTNRKNPSFSFAPSERYLRSTPAARLSASVIPLP